MNTLAGRNRPTGWVALELRGMHGVYCRRVPTSSTQQGKREDTGQRICRLFDKTLFTVHWHWE